MSDSVRPHRRQPTRPPRPWDSPGRALEWGAIAFSDILGRLLTYGLCCVSVPCTELACKPSEGPFVSFSDLFSSENVYSFLIFLSVGLGVETYASHTLV